MKIHRRSMCSTLVSQANIKASSDAKWKGLDAFLPLGFQSQMKLDLRMDLQMMAKLYFTTLIESKGPLANNICYLCPNTNMLIKQKEMLTIVDGFLPYHHIL